MDKARNEWTDWICENLLRNKSLWLVNQPMSCSWVWRKILSHRHLMCSLIAWWMGDRSRISFWMDNWLPCGPIISQVRKEFIQKIGFRLDISIKDFYEFNIWRSFTQTSSDRSTWRIQPLLVHLSSIIPHSLMLNHDNDTTIWKSSPSGQFTTKFAWNAILTHFPNLWNKIVWFLSAIPNLVLFFGCSSMTNFLQGTKCAN